MSPRLGDFVSRAERWKDGLAELAPPSRELHAVIPFYCFRNFAVFRGYTLVRQAAKLSPQEQCEVAFGLVTLNPPFCKSSLKSRVDPLTNNALLGSTTIRTLPD